MPVEDLKTDLRERIRSREIAQAHFVAELSNEPDTILKSMKSWRLTQLEAFEAVC